MRVRRRTLNRICNSVEFNHRCIYVVINKKRIVVGFRESTGGLGFAGTSRSLRSTLVEQAWEARLPSSDFHGCLNQDGRNSRDDQDHMTKK